VTFKKTLVQLPSALIAMAYQSWAEFNSVKTLPVGGESETVGVAVGETVGVAVGETVGVAVGETVGVAVGETVGVASDTSDTQMLPAWISTAILAPKRQKNYRCRKRGFRGSNKDAGSIAVSAHRDRIPQFIPVDRRIFDKGAACVPNRSNRIPNRSTKDISRGDGDDLRACMTKKNDDLCIMQRGFRGFQKDAGSIAVSAHRDRTPHLRRADGRVFGESVASVNIIIITSICVVFVIRQPDAAALGDCGHFFAWTKTKNIADVKEAFKKTLARLPSELIAIERQLWGEPTDLFSVKVSPEFVETQTLPSRTTNAIFVPE
jgi:hypothetical protein